MDFLFGALKPKVDKRDYTIAAGASKLPDSYTIPYLPPVKNQKAVSSCVAHATAVILEYFHKIETNQKDAMSTDFIYGMQGVAYGRKSKGMYLRDACKIAKDYGDLLKERLSTNTEQPECCEKLEQMMTDEIKWSAATNRIKSYAKCDGIENIKHALVNYGPLLASVNWHKECEITEEGMVFMDYDSPHGRHAIVIYGYDKRGWLCQNSWGKSFAKDGRFILPYTEEFNEVWSFVDAANDDIHIPKTNSFLDIIYKFINSIINLFKR